MCEAVLVKGVPTTLRTRKSEQSQLNSWCWDYTIRQKWSPWRTWPDIWRRLWTTSSRRSRSWKDWPRGPSWESNLAFELCTSLFPSGHWFLSFNEDYPRVVRNKKKLQPSQSHSFYQLSLHLGWLNKAIPTNFARPILKRLRLAKKTLSIPKHELDFFHRIFCHSVRSTRECNCAGH